MLRLAGSKAKLNSRKITTANASDAFKASLVRISERKSFAAMASDWRRNVMQRFNCRHTSGTTSPRHRAFPGAVPPQRRSGRAGLERRAWPAPAPRGADAWTSLRFLRADAFRRAWNVVRQSHGRRGL